MATSTMDALVLDAENKTARVKKIPRPGPAQDEVLVRVHSVALNPVDSLYVASPLGATGRTVGSDFSGTVVAGGSRSHGLAAGARVAGFLQGAGSANDRPGAFAEYLACPADLLWRVSDGVELQEAATVPLCAMTAAQAVFYRLGLPAPFTWDGSEGKTREATGARDSSSSGGGGEQGEPLHFFIYGASTSVAMYAAQLVHHAARAAGSSRGRKIVLIGAASRARFAMLQAAPYSYDSLVDYREPDWPEQVRRLTPAGRGVDFVYDCIAEGQTVRLASGLLRGDGEGGKMAIVRSREGCAFDVEGVKGEPIYGAVWEAFGVEVLYRGMTVPASTGARAFAVAFYAWLSEGGQGEERKLVPNPVRLMPGGLQEIVGDGFVVLGGGSMEDRLHGRREEWMRPVSGEKLVYRVFSGQ